MSEQSIDVRSVASRVDDLLRQLRFLRAGVVTLFIAWAASLFPGMPWVHSTVKARRFVLRDETGRTRADLSVRDSAPVLRFYDSSGATLLEMGKSSRGTGVAIFGMDQRMRIALLTTSKGRNGLVVMNDEEKPALATFASEGGVAFEMYGREDTHLVEIHANTTHGGGIRLAKPGGEPGWSAP